MIDLTQRLKQLSPVKQGLLQQRLRRRPDIAEPIAVVGMACRFPGAADLESYWQLLSSGRDATGEIPASRWDIEKFFDPTGELPGRMSTRWGAFLEEVDRFDGLFFGITPREAAKMDPQQRLLLEVAWETLEQAGLPADELAGSSTGAFVGIGATDYSKIPTQFANYYEHIDAHVGTGNALSIAANRLSYVFDLRGPSLAVDTACSSALVALHLAVLSLRNRHCDAALAGGVNLILSPETTIAFSKARMLSPDGQCRPFDAKANGYVRGEGCGVVLLKRLPDAIRAGDNILAVIRDTAVNQDGRTSGITAPNALAQQAVIRSALAHAGLSPHRISYIEAHGTGTPLGDPIEIQSLSEVFRRQRAADPPCFVTSVKANVGHLETASGMAGLIKVILMMQHGQILPQLHLERLNPNIHLSGSRLEIPRQVIAWDDEGPRLAGVNSFGFGGTNAHVLLESAGARADDRSARHEITGPAPKQRPASAAAPQQQATARPVHVLALSAKNEKALAQLAERYSEQLKKSPDIALGDICYSANTGRSHFNHRLTVTAADRQQMARSLENLAGRDKAKPKGEAANKESAPTGVCKRGHVKGAARPKVVFLFTGQGAQYVGMGRELFETHPIFRRTLQQCDEILAQWMDESLLDVIYPRNGQPALLDETIYTQPSLFAIEYSLAMLWKSWGVRPDVVMGHSVGEYVAACVAGVFDLERGLQLIYDRARLMQQLPHDGKMAVIFAAADQVARVITKDAPEVSIAAINGPDNTVISGPARAVDALVAHFDQQGVRAQRLTVSHAFHSSLMEPILDDFEQLAATVPHAEPQIPLILNLTGKEAEAGALTAGYWRQHMRQTVRFADGLQSLAAERPQAVVEIGPTTSLLSMSRRCLPKLESLWLPSLRKGQGDWQVMTNSLSDLYLLGAKIDWRGFDLPWPRRRVPLPTYPFQRARHWFDLESGKRPPMAQSRGPLLHPLLGSRVPAALDTTLYETRWSSRAPAYLQDHQVQGSTVAPAAAYIEQGLAAAQQQLGGGSFVLQQVTVQQAMFLPEGGSRTVQTTVGSEIAGFRDFAIHSQPAEDTAQSSWTLHACGKIQLAPAESQEVRETVDLESVRSRAVDRKTAEQFYTMMKERGLAYGPSFRMLDDLQRTPIDGVARVQLPEQVQRELAEYHLHPALLDAFFQTMACVVPLEEDGSYSPYTYVPTGVRKITVFERPEGELLTYGIRTSSESGPSPERVEGDVLLLGSDGRVLVELRGVQVQRLGRSSPKQASDQSDASQWLYQLRWEKQNEERDTARAGSPLRSSSDEAAKATGSWLIFADRDGVGQQLAQLIRQRGEQAILVTPGAANLAASAQHDCSISIDPLDRSAYQQILEQSLQESAPLRGVVHLWSLDIGFPEQAAERFLEEARSLGCGSALNLVQQLVRLNTATPPALVLVTRGSLAVSAGEQEKIHVAQSPLWGFGRVAAIEHPELRCRLIDLDSGGDAAETASLLLSELERDPHERQVAFRQGERYVARLEQAAELAEQDATEGPLPLPNRRPFRLEITAAGSFDALRFRPYARSAPQAGQVEIEIRATGLNFSDVLKALGLYPGITDEVVPLGIEASGVVSAVGADVTGLKVGDPVMGVIPYAFASHAVTAQYALVRRPDQLDDAEAATVPITFLTAYHALCHLARLQPGQRVLIHAGAGGVGLAAIQIAQHLGCEIFSTAGSEEKREFLRSLGVPHVFNSRTLEFADRIMEITERRGVDVVLNSLPGEAISKSLSALAAYGRFLEIGKTDIYQNRMIGLLPFQDNLSYFAIDLDRVLRQRPDYIRQLLGEVLDHFQQGHYRPLPLTLFSAAETIDAFRYMAQRKNIGKVVVSLGDLPEQEPSGSSPGKLVQQDASYLISGGTGALGLQLAEWLVSQGAGHLLLLARRAPRDAGLERIERLRASGATIEVLEADIADQMALGRALADGAAQRPPLRGVIHAAGVLDDSLLFDLDLERLEKVMAPKVRGAWNLHCATRNRQLDFFVMFSSIAALLGSPGQANYAAGNAFLDALAEHRRSQGLPTLSVNWGPWSGAGMAGEEGRSEQIQSRGMQLIQPQAGLELLGALLRSGTARAAVVNAQWNQLVQRLPGGTPALLERVVQPSSGVEQATADSQVNHQLRHELLSASADQRREMLRDYFRAELAAIMGIDPGALDADQPLNAMGLDSLMALELKNKLENRLNINLPMARFLEGPSIDSLARCAADLLVDGQVAAEQETTRAPTQMLGTAHWEPLVQLKAGSAKPALFCLHPLGGEVRCYEGLARAIGEDRPVFALRPRGAEGVLPPHDSMAAMAADYAEALCQAQRSGPYALVGWSAGGLLAFELAHELQRRKQQVKLLALIDAPMPTIYDNVDLQDDARFLCDLVNFTNIFSGSTMQISYDQLQALPVDQRFEAALAEAKKHGVVPAEVPTSHVRHLVGVGKAQVRWVKQYQIRPLQTPINVHLFRAQQRGVLFRLSGVEFPEDLGWGRVVGDRLVMHPTPGDHFTMMTGPGAEALASAITKLLQ